MRARILLFFACLSLPTIASAATPRELAIRLFDRLAGTPIALADPRLAQMEAHIREGRFAEAAHIATEDNGFYDITLVHWASPMSNRGRTPRVPLNDFTAMVVGVTRDDTNAQELLYGNYSYYGFIDSGSLEEARTNANHFERLGDTRASLKVLLRKVEPQLTGVRDAAGLLTTRAWASAHLRAGTNRRAVQFAFQEFLCTEIEQIKDFSLRDHRVRRDVDRAPAGRAANYNTNCVGCHSGMDALGGAYAKFDFVDNNIVQLSSVAPKMNQNSGQFPGGYYTYDDSWMNLWTRNHNASFGWRGSLQGRGVHAFGRMLANSRAFSSCMAKRVFEEVCLRASVAADTAQITTLAQQFEASGYKLRRLFELAAITPACLGR